MTKPQQADVNTDEGPASDPSGSRGSPWGSYDAWVKSLRRSRSNRIVAGVAGGLADSIGVPALIIRLGFILAGIVFIGIPIYIVAWLLIPDEGSDEAVVRPGRAPAACVLGLLGLLMLNGVMGGALIGRMIVPLGLMLLGAALIVRRPVERPTGSQTATQAAAGQMHQPQAISQPQALAAVLGVLGALNIRTNSLDPTFDLVVATEGELPRTLQASAGASTLDLSSLELAADRTVRIDQTAGRVRVLLPRETTVRVKAEVGLGNITLLRPSRQSAVSLDEDLRKKWVTDGVPLEGSPVEQSIVSSLNSLPYMYLQPVTSKSSDGVGKSVGYNLDRASVWAIIDLYWSSDGWKPVVPTQLCTVGGGPTGVVEACDDVEITKRVALCINDNGYLVDCREDRPATIDNLRVPACRDFSGEYIDCQSVGIEPVNAQLVSPTEPPAKGETPKPTIVMPAASSAESSSGTATTTPQTTAPATSVPATTGD